MESFIKIKNKFNVNNSSRDPASVYNFRLLFSFEFVIYSIQVNVEKHKKQHFLEVLKLNSHDQIT